MLSTCNVRQALQGLGAMVCTTCTMCALLCASMQQGSLPPPPPPACTACRERRWERRGKRSNAATLTAMVHHHWGAAHKASGETLAGGIASQGFRVNVLGGLRSLTLDAGSSLTRSMALQLSPGVEKALMGACAPSTCRRRAPVLRIMRPYPKWHKRLGCSAPAPELATLMQCACIPL
jgi:hypothetical protein